MSKDKYSNDHTVTVIGDTQTLFIEENLEASNNVIADNSVVTDSVESRTTDIVTVNDNLTVAEDLLVEKNSEFAGSILVQDQIRTNAGYKGPRDSRILLFPSPIAPIQKAHLEFGLTVIAPNGPTGPSINTAVIPIGVLGFTSDDKIFSIDGLIQDPNISPRWYGQSFHGSFGLSFDVDYRWGVVYDDGAQALVISFIGDDWQGDDGLVTVIRLTVWYEPG